MCVRSNVCSGHSGKSKGKEPKVGKGKSKRYRNKTDVAKRSTRR